MFEGEEKEIRAFGSFNFHDLRRSARAATSPPIPLISPALRIKEAVAADGMMTLPFAFAAFGEKGAERGESEPEVAAQVEMTVAVAE